MSVSISSVWASISQYDVAMLTHEGIHPNYHARYCSRTHDGGMWLSAKSSYLLIDSDELTLQGEATQVFSLDPSHKGDLCLVGTAEIPLNGLIINKILHAKLIVSSIVRQCDYSRPARAQKTRCFWPCFPR
jgi:hypothetical protein